MIDQSLKHLVPPYLERRKRDLARLREALEQKDFATIQAIGHQIRGNAGNLGFDELGTMGERLEEAASAGDLEQVRVVTAEIESFVNGISLE